MPRGRPLSPHLQVYTPLINMTMSIVHRITGGALYFGTVILAVWLFAASTGRGSFDIINSLIGSPVGIVVMALYTWALVHHALGGIRHLIWDTGRAFELGSVNALSWGTIILSPIVTAAIWALVITLKGGL
ncbi:MAG: succinate dehydrogenase, cytochrome b556 subunit [Hyphomicrobiaceae bacterium]